ncbi:MAG TPA: asparagine synthase (glutamine-hydrolyzing) [Nitrospira sp.]|nr:asparagine synthase (glutamine-hydrolyzing) [Nitrospira sp.]
MCAIAGYYYSAGAPPDATLLSRMVDIQRHRGPDGVGYVFLDPTGHQQPEPHRTLARVSTMARRAGLALGHRRLAILDRSDRAHQPMASADGVDWLVYNGEIYNYRELREELRAKGYHFRSASDTEVLLTAYREWGIGCVKRFNGMFAFALWDGTSHRLVCGRDRFGEKPFYYVWNEQCFAFGSEIKALLPVLGQRGPDQELIYAYLDRGALDASDRTMLSGVRQLPPAHMLVVENGRLAINPYWQLPSCERETTGTFDAAVETFASLFRDSVRLRLRSDVPVGSCLSGGLDSSSIVCTMHRLLAEDRDATRNAPDTGQHVFSSCFQDAAYDERRYRDHVVRETGVTTHDVFPDDTILADDIPRVVWHQEEPFGSTSVFAQWCVMRTASEQGLKVLLDGQGADELLAGYHGFFGPVLADLIRNGRWASLIREYGSYRRLHGAWPRYVYANFARAMLPAAFVRTVRGRMTGSARWMDREFRQRWRDDDEPGVELEGTVLQRMQAMLLTGNGLRALLHYEDRNAMAFGIETRLPFLDHRLVEFVWPLPNHHKIRDGITKVLLREAMKGVLPEPVRQRVDKMGFVTPEDRWFRAGLREMTGALLHDSRTATRGYVNIKTARKDFQAHVTGRVNIGNTLWRWLNLELWCRQFLDEDPCARSPSTAAMNSADAALLPHETEAGL